MKIYQLAVSNEAPSLRNAAWLKPVSGGFALYVLNGCVWQPLKIVDDNGTPITSDDIAENADSIKTDAVNTVVGTDKDTSTDMTLYGLKAYVDEQIQSLG